MALFASPIFATSSMLLTCLSWLQWIHMPKRHDEQKWYPGPLPNMSLLLQFSQTGGSPVVGASSSMTKVRLRAQCGHSTAVSKNGMSVTDPEAARDLRLKFLTKEPNDPPDSRRDVVDSLRAGPVSRDATGATVAVDRPPCCGRAEDRLPSSSPSNRTAALSTSLSKPVSSPFSNRWKKPPNWSPDRDSCCCSAVAARGLTEA
mmetsp:Transcript_89450/g.204510  ORF Transcript_89450/g.204510 Transcript_89450/m.204510 type:complete len:203 (-) Transcript_89450:82-690(-)